MPATSSEIPLPSQSGCNESTAEPVAGSREHAATGAGVAAGEGAGSRSPLPTADSTTKRSTVAWWFVFLGPAALVGALVIAGTFDGPSSAMWVFSLGVWAFTLTLGLAAAPRKLGLWWVVPLAVSFAAAAVAVGLLLTIGYAAGKVGNKPSARTSGRASVAATTSPAAGAQRLALPVKPSGGASSTD